ncbi:MAG: MBL fold metallo-hydrolase [Dehalococcoidia bacterium]|nr:MBL fold metallo-hydrolase [Dehalococcoidia bacterium]MDW8009936.1 MBL fold metallo-hydrolase [Chloroflexota bacterium]
MASETPGRAPAPQLQEVSPGIYAYLQPDWSWFLNNTGFIVGRRGVIAVDACATAARTQALAEAIGRISRAPVRALVNTHHHGDHTFGNYRFPGAAIIAHELCRRHVLEVGLRVTALVQGVEWGDLEVDPPFVTFQDSITLWADDLRLEVIYVGPAHTSNDVVVWVPERRVLFAGDVVFKGCTPFVLEGCIGHYFETLDRLRELGPEVVVPGHGPVCGPEAFGEVEGYLRFLQERAREALRAGITDPLEAARQIDLGPYAEWGERERIVGNLARAFSELRGEPPCHPLDTPAIVAQMQQYLGQPLRSLA